MGKEIINALREKLKPLWRDEAARYSGAQVEDLLKECLNELLDNTDTFSEAVEYISKASTVTTVSNIPTDKRLVIAEITASESFSLAETLESGKEIHVIVKNTGAETLTVTLPNDGGYVCFVDSALSIDADSYAEINVVSDGENMYIRAI